MTPRSKLLPWAGAVASGAAMALALPLALPVGSLRELDPAGRLQVVAWLALVPAILAVRAAPTWRAAALRGLVAGLAYFYASIWWVSHAMTAFGGLPAWLALVALTLLVLYMAAHWAAAFAISWKIRDGLGWPMPAHLPLVWAALELCRNYLFTGFPWANLGYTQAKALPIAQLAALGGPYAIAALVVLVNAALAESVAARREQRPLPRRALAAAALLLAAAWGWGALRLRAQRARIAAAPAITVGIVQPNLNQSVKNRMREEPDYVLSRLVPLTLEADRDGADLVAWPEATFPLAVPPQIRSFARGASLPPLSRAHLLMGAVTYQQTRAPDGRPLRSVGNVDFLLSPSLDVLGKYQKHHLVPFGEYVPLHEWLPFLGQVVPGLAPASPGRELTVLEFTPGAAAAATAAVTPTSTATSPPASDPVRLAPMICFDAIFPEINVAYARKTPEPEILVNPTNDAWYGYSSGPYQFLAIVRLRAIEAGKAVVRPAFAGVSAVILPTGEVAPGALEVGPVDPDLAKDPDEPARLLLAPVPRLRGLTPYTTFGDLFAWTCAALSAAGLAAAVRAGRRRAAGS